jgi:hypothetical protein
VPLLYKSSISISRHGGEEQWLGKNTEKTPCRRDVKIFLNSGPIKVNQKMAFLSLKFGNLENKIAGRVRN